MKKLLFLIGLVLSLFVSGQQITDELIVNDGASIGTSDLPRGNAILDIDSDSKGVLFPTLTTTQRDAIVTTPLDSGLVVYNVTDSIYQYFSGSQWLDMGGGDNMATADLTLATARTHNLSGNILKFDADETGYIEVGNVAVTEGIKLYQKSNGINYVNTGYGNLLVGAEGNDNLSIKTDGTSQFNDNLKIGSGSIGGTAARLKVRGNSLTTGECFIFEDSGGREILRGSNNRQLYSRTLNITGLGATSATTALLVENSVGTDLFKIDDAGGFALGTGAIYGNLNCVAIGANADAEDNSSPTTAKLIAIGADSYANGSGSVSLGVESSSNSQSISVGFSSFSQFFSTAIGYNANASNTGVALGHSANSSNTRAIAIGNSSTSSRFGGLAIGYTANVGTSGNYGMALGAGANVTAGNSVLISTKGTTQTNSTANTFEVNLDNTTSIFRFGNTVDGWLNSTGNFAFGTTTPDASAKLEVSSTTGGFLPPRMTTTERDAIATPAAGLVIFNTTTGKHEGYDGTTWNAFY